MLSLLRFCCCLVTKSCLTVLWCYGLHTPVRMVIIKKSTNNKFWRRYGEKEILLHCLWESKLVQPPCRTVWRFLKKLWLELPCVCARSVLSDSLRPHGLQPTRLLCPQDSPGKDTGMGSYSLLHFLLQGIFPTQGSNPSLLHCRQTLNRLSHQGSPEWKKVIANEKTDKELVSKIYKQLM